MEPFQSSEGEVYIGIQRTSNNIIATNDVFDQNGIQIFFAGQPVRLAFPLFGANDLGAGYTKTLQYFYNLLNQACPGITYEINAATGLTIPGNLYITWIYGAQSDTLMVYYAGSPLTNYANIVSNTNQPKNAFKVPFINYVISDGAGAAQISQGLIQIVKLSAGGSIEVSEKYPDASRLAQDTQNDRVGISFDNLIIDAEVGIADSIIPCPKAIPFTVYYHISKIALSKEEIGE